VLFAPSSPPPLAPARGRRGAKRIRLIAFEYQFVATIASRGQVRGLGDVPYLIVPPLFLPGEEKGSGDEVCEAAQFAFCELHGVREEKSRSWLGLGVRIVLSNAVLVLREAVLVLEPTAIFIAAMNDRSWLIEVGVSRVRVPLH